MFVRILFFILMALSLVGFGTVAWVTTRPTQAVEAAQQPATPSPRKSVLITTHPLRAGSLLKPEDLGSKDVQESEIGPGMTLDSPEVRRALAGSMLKRSFGEAEALLDIDLLKPGEHGFLAAVLEPGARAVTIPVDAASGAAGLVWPGDRVDVIVTQTNGDPSLPVGRRIGADTVLTNVRVIAIDQQMIQGGRAGVGDAPAKTVTLEVSAEQAQRLTVAMRLGQISLAVRSATSEGQAQARDGRSIPTWARDVLPSMLTEALPPAAEPKIRVFQGAGDVREFKF
jgi:pilus assembly protein CpaB